jgi:hypothetical protein
MGEVEIESGKESGLVPSKKKRERVCEFPFSLEPVTKPIFTMALESRTNCPNTATAWGVSIDSGNRIITITTPTSVAQTTPVATGTTVTITLGSNATFQNTGVIGYAILLLPAPRRSR